MSWTLTPSGSTAITLPNPQGYSRKELEKAVYHEMINGASKKDISNRKAQFVLNYFRRTQAEIASIMALYNQGVTAIFEVSDGELSIGPTEVHIDIDNRNYNTKGSEFREDFNLILTEVQ